MSTDKTTSWAQELSQQSGVPVKNIEIAQETVQNFLNMQLKSQINVQDPCNTKNHGVLKLPEPTEKRDLNISAFIPAAGAASRFFKPLNKIIQTIRNADFLGFSEEWIKVKKFPLPPQVRALKDKTFFTDSNARSAALAALDQPKALMPCSETSCFLNEKERELKAYDFISQTCFVVPLGKQQNFSDALSNKETSFFEQNEKLSTFRFDEQGSVIQKDSRPSVAPAGHGALSALFPDLKSLGHEHLFIQNIDNLTGSSEAVCTALASLKDQYAMLFEGICEIRSSIGNHFADAENTANKIIRALGMSMSDFPKKKSSLDILFHCIFHRPKGLSFREMASAPVQVLGMVPNKANHVGGIPFLWQSNVGLVKICLEGPHIPDAGKDSMSKHPSYFNPVTVLSEIQSSTNAFEKTSKDFWFVADKTFEGKRALYMETALYELLSDSRHHNVVFAELPEQTFRPHKTLIDCIKQP